MGKGLGYVNITVQDKEDLRDRPAIIRIGGKLIEDIIDAISTALAGKASTADLANKADKSDLDKKANASTVASKTDLSVIAPSYDDTATYSAGDVVVKSGKLYQCKTAVETAEAFDPEKWTEVTVASLIAQAAQ